ncbi:MAG: HPr(Ser) kinase/phosphatase [Gemmatimonadetes bacterium]|nr:HPr(Ser) kinase/phosphatase [Gemmatimonadota bacterium]NNF38244.1 HPr(Ser) kinase/phosphatase [Gemmatimonadota bacterium]NNK62085.1 HPr(Ser) kinase/phosphatase [Gemmatimonadota bacterium]
MSPPSNSAFGTPVTVADILDTKAEILDLEMLTPGVRLDRVVDDPDISSPGLALAGFTARFPSGRMQVLGETEMTYLASLDPAVMRSRLEALFEFEIPALFVTKRQDVPAVLIELASAAGVPVILSGTTTKDFYWRIKPFLEAALAPSEHLHGSLADVYGVGLLFVGKSGVGKSECVLDLVERGHRLVADDLVLAHRRGNDVLLGRGHPLQRHHMEIRGIGIIDIRALFGVRAIRQQKRIEVVVNLEHWDEARTYTRTGLETESTEILGVTLPRVTVPLNPGKNITVISEVVAMNHLLRYSGLDSAEAFDNHLRAYLEQDYE